MSKNMPKRLRMMLWLYNKMPRTLDQMSVTEARLYVGSSNVGNIVNDFLFDHAPFAMYHIENKQIIGRNGKIPIRIYQPTAKKDLPIVVFFHGGGFVLNSIETHDKVCRRIAQNSEVIVVSVDYRLAPEFKFPAGLHDCYDALEWASKNAKSIGGNANQLMVMGDSAGGNLAAAICLMARDLNGPEIAAQLLIYPCTDGRLDHPSIKRLNEKYILTENILHWFLNHYKKDKKDILDPYFSVLLAEDLSKLPPTLLVVGEYDPLIDECKAYAKRLQQAGNKVQFSTYPGMVHTFFTMPKISKKAAKVYKEISSFIN